MALSFDAIVIGAGHNGLTAAAVYAWRVGTSPHENWRATAWGQTPGLPDH